MGPLGERLDSSLARRRDEPLQLRVARPSHEVITSRAAHGGLVVVGAGRLEFWGRTARPTGRGSTRGVHVSQRALRAAPAPARYAPREGGALVLLAERGVAQELLVTCPPLLEIFAGG